MRETITREGLVDSAIDAAGDA